jgi:hypothetical protein
MHSSDKVVVMFSEASYPVMWYSQVSTFTVALTGPPPVGDKQFGLQETGSPGFPTAWHPPAPSGAQIHVCGSRPVMLPFPEHVTIVSQVTGSIVATIVRSQLDSHSVNGDVLVSS